MTVTRSEWAWVAGVFLFVIALTQAPPTVARLFGPEDRVHIGTYWYSTDFSAYLAAMREGAASSTWLVHSHFSAEPHNGIVMFPLYVAIGKIAAASGLPLLGVYAAVEHLGRVVLLLALYAFVSTIVLTVGGRRLAFLAAAFTGGLSTIVGLVQAAVGIEAMRPVNASIELSSFGAFFAAPHLSLGLALTLFAVILFPQAARGSPRGLALLAANQFALSAIHPYVLPVPVSAFIVFAIVESIRKKRLDWGSLAATLLGGLACAPILLYDFFTFTFDPFWSATYSGQQLTPSPLLWELPLDFGVIVLLAPFGILPLWRRHEPRATMFLAWFGCAVLWTYAPVPYQIRFALGLQPALGVLAVTAWPLFQARAAKLAPAGRGTSFTRIWLAAPLMLLAVSAPLVIYAAIVVSAASNRPIGLYGIDRDSYLAVEQITSSMRSDDVVAASFSAGNVLGGRIPGRMVAGNATATLRARQKSASLTAMYRGELTPQETRAFLQANRVTYLLVGGEERKLGSHDPGAELALPLVVTWGQARIYDARGVI